MEKYEYDQQFSSVQKIVKPQPQFDCYLNPDPSYSQDTKDITAAGILAVKPKASFGARGYGNSELFITYKPITVVPGLHYPLQCTALLLENGAIKSKTQFFT